MQFSELLCVSPDSYREEWKSFKKKFFVFFKDCNGRPDPTFSVGSRPKKNNKLIYSMQFKKFIK